MTLSTVPYANPPLKKGSRRDAAAGWYELIGEQNFSYRS